MRKKIIALIGMAGFGLAIYTIIGLASEPIIAKIIHHSINHKHHVSSYQLVIGFIAGNLRTVHLFQL